MRTLKEKVAALAERLAANFRGDADLKYRVEALERKLEKRVKTLDADE
ncbi:MAG: hypothetical protein M3P49_08200 [Actinomycetota bacterium]|nr:hypothetical protein [Actinomycetota bacterium]